MAVIYQVYTKHDGWANVEEKLYNKHKGRLARRKLQLISEDNPEDFKPKVLTIREKINSHGAQQIWYREELVAMLTEYNLPTSQMKEAEMYRWYPYEVIEFLESKGILGTPFVAVDDPEYSHQFTPTKIDHDDTFPEAGSDD